MTKSTHVATYYPSDGNFFDWAARQWPRCRNPSYFPATLKAIAAGDILFFFRGSIADIEREHFADNGQRVKEIDGHWFASPR